MAELIPPRRGEFLTANGEPTQRFIAWIESLTTDVNETVGEVSEASELISGSSEADEIGQEAEVDLAFIMPHSIEPLEVITTNADYTTTGLERLVIAESDITITLNHLPDDLEVVSIKRASTDGAVIVSGAIDGDTEYNMTQNYESIELIFSASSDEWLII